jgi:hypothetical protein
MNGRRAKKLAVLAQQICIMEKIGWSEGYNEYNQLDNCISWEPAFDEQTGLPMRDPEGFKLLKPVKNPGTLQTAWKFRIIYKNLKRIWKQTGGQHELFLTA